MTRDLLVAALKVLGAFAVACVMLFAWGLCLAARRGDEVKARVWDARREITLSK